MSNVYRVTVKYGKKKHKNVEIKAGDSFEDIQGIIFSLTQVNPERQKIIIGGKKLDNDEDVSKLVKNKVLITVMGSTTDKTITSAAAKNIAFLGDLTTEQKLQAFAELPPGLHNLGNTCYLNSCIQSMKSVTELKERLKSYAVANTNNTSMSTKLGQLMLDLDTNSDAVTPQQFVQYFRGAFPRFASRNEHGIWEQQDADEAYTEIVSALRQDASFKVEVEAEAETESKLELNVINDLFEGEFESKTVCDECDEEAALNVTERFIKLQCFIDINTRHINDGINKGFEEKVEKLSDRLGRNALWTKSKRISKLPKYFTIQLVRFFWKQKSQKNAKILRKVIFPEKLDVYDFCNEKLRKSVETYRRLKLEKEDKEREKKQALSQEADKEKEKEKEAAATEEKTEMDVDVDVNDNDKQELFSGYYELCGIVTHKGRSANSGHYIGYAKDKQRNKWLKFDDDEVTEIKSDDIKQLYGGGDFQMAFLTIYRRIDADL